MMKLQFPCSEERTVRLACFSQGLGLGAGECLRKPLKKALEHGKPRRETGSMWWAVVDEQQLFSQGVNLIHG
jgi:hypothetical protein